MLKSQNKNLENHYDLKYYLIFFIILFVSDDTFNFGTNSNSTYLSIKYIVYLFLTIYLFLNLKLKFFIRLTKGSLIFYLIVFFVFCTAIFNFELSGGYFYQIWLFLLGLLIVNFYPYQTFIDVFLKSIYVLSLISLIIFVLSNLFPSFIQLFPSQINSNGSGIHNLGLGIVSFENEIVRNSSIFREPGVFMIYLNVAVFLEFFRKNKLNKKYIFVFILTIFSTVSTAAFIVLATLLIAYLFIDNKNASSIKIRLLVMGFMIFFGIIIFLSDDLYTMIFAKIAGDNISDGSSLARGISIVTNLNIFLSHFFFGAGIRNYPMLFEQFTLNFIGIAFGVGNNTNTITTILAVYGVFFGSIFVYMLISLSKMASGSIIANLLVFLSLIMLYSNEDMRYSLFSAIILMWGLRAQKSKFKYEK